MNESFVGLKYQRCVQNQGTNAFAIHWSTRIPPASKHWMYYRPPWLRCYQWHSDVGRPDDTRKTTCKGLTTRAASMTSQFRTSVVSWCVLRWKFQDVTCSPYLASSPLMRSGHKQNSMNKLLSADGPSEKWDPSYWQSSPYTPPQWWQPGVSPPMSRCPRWHWSQYCRTPPLPGGCGFFGLDFQKTSPNLTT